MKKILLISSLYYPHVGGVETMVRELARLYRKEKIEVNVLSKKWPISLFDYEVYEDVDIYRVPSARTDNEFLAIANWIKEHGNNMKPDIIHVIGARRPLPLIALVLRYYWNVPLVLTIAGGDIPDKNYPYPGTVWEESKSTVYPVFEHADIITCVSEDITRDFRHFFPEIKTAVETLYAGIDIEYIDKAPKEKYCDDYIFSLRRLDPTKGIHILIEAFAIITRTYSNLRLVIAGDGSERPYLEELVQKLRLGDNVKFIGTIGLERGISLLKGAKLTVVPSLSEAGGLVNVEAQAAGCPVVATRVGGIPEYVQDGISGLLCRPNDVPDLAKKIMLLLGDKELRGKMIEGGLAHARKFDWEVLGPKYLSLYDSIIEMFKRRELCQDALFQLMWNSL